MIGARLSLGVSSWFQLLTEEENLFARGHQHAREKRENLLLIRQRSHVVRHPNHFAIETAELGLSLVVILNAALRQRSHVVQIALGVYRRPWCWKLYATCFGLLRT